MATRDVFIAVVMEQATREDLARAFRVSPATIGSVVTRFKRGGARAVAEYGRRGGLRVRTPKLVQRLTELFERGLGPRAAYRAVSKLAGYGTVQAVHHAWSKSRTSAVVPPPPQQELALIASNEKAAAEAPEASLAEATSSGATPGEPTLDEMPPTGTVVQHVGSWLLLGGLHKLGFYELAAQHRGDAVEMAALRCGRGGGSSPSVSRIRLLRGRRAACRSVLEGASRYRTPQVQLTEHPIPDPDPQVVPPTPRK